MWIFVVTSFTRYSKIGREAQKKFDSEIQKDGFFHLHSNIFVRYCVSSKNATIHKERVKVLIPEAGCDVSILLIPDNMENNIYHSLGRRRKKKICYDKPQMVEFI